MDKFKMVVYKYGSVEDAALGWTVMRERKQDWGLRQNRKAAEGLDSENSLLTTTMTMVERRLWERREE